MDALARCAGLPVNALQHVHYDKVAGSHSGGEHAVHGTRWHVDGYTEDEKVAELLGVPSPTLPTILEFLGHESHGFPDASRNTGCNYRGATYQSLYDKTMARFEAIAVLGYNVLYIWEEDYKEWKRHSVGTSLLSYVKTVF